MTSCLSSHHLNLATPSPGLISAGDRDLASVVNSSVLEGGLKVHSPARASFLETDVGVSTLMLLRIIQGSSAVLVNDTDWRHCVKRLKSVTKQVLRLGYTDDGCEVLYGRAGFLYALLSIRRSLQLRADSTERAAPANKFLDTLERLVSDDNIRAVVEAIVGIGRKGAREYAADISGSDLTGPPLMWAWHAKRYLGAAHDVAGILQILWSCPSHIVTPYMPDVVGTVMWLVDQQDESGNWPAKAPDSRSGRGGNNELVQYVQTFIQVSSDT